MDPVVQAEIIFKESLSSLMAHTIRATTNHFAKHKLDLDLTILPDIYGTVIVGKNGRKPSSILTSRFSGSAHGTTGRPRVHAKIYIHRDANKHLARLAIAHEIGHLLFELSEWALSDKKSWKQIATSKTLEDTCNVFAWQLCRDHDEFNRNEENRSKHIFFPQSCFETTLNIDLSATDNLPLGIGLDPAKPFWKQH